MWKITNWFLITFLRKCIELWTDLKITKINNKYYSIKIKKTEQIIDIYLFILILIIFIRKSSLIIVKYYSIITRCDIYNKIISMYIPIPNFGHISTIDQAVPITFFLTLSNSHKSIVRRSFSTTTVVKEWSLL